MSVQRDLHLDRGADWAATITITDAGSPVDLSSYTANWYVDGLSQARVAGTVAITTGLISLSLSHTDTAGMSLGVGHWELWLTAASKLTRLYSGAVHVS